jgi:hypothetical protein
MRHDNLREHQLLCSRLELSQIVKEHHPTTVECVTGKTQS